MFEADGAIGVVHASIICTSTVALGAATARVTRQAGPREQRRRRSRWRGAGVERARRAVVVLPRRRHRRVADSIREQLVGAARRQRIEGHHRSSIPTRRADIQRRGAGRRARRGRGDARGTTRGLGLVVRHAQTQHVVSRGIRSKRRHRGVARRGRGGGADRGADHGPRKTHRAAVRVDAAAGQRDRGPFHGRLRTRAHRGRRKARADVLFVDRHIAIVIERVAHLAGRARRARCTSPIDPNRCTSRCPRCTRQRRCRNFAPPR